MTLISRLMRALVSVLNKTVDQYLIFVDADTSEVHKLFQCFCTDAISFLFVLRFYGPVNPMGSCRAWSVYLTTRLLGRLSPLSG